MVLQSSSVSSIADDPQLLVIPAGSVKSKSDFHDEIFRLLKLQAWYGRNLDAFNDVLRGGCGDVVPSDKIFVWQGHQQAKQALGDSYWKDIIEIFEEANADDEEGTVGVLNATTGKREKNLRLE